MRRIAEGVTWITQDRTRDIATVRTAWDEVKRMIADPAYDLIVADELNIVLRYDYLDINAKIIRITQNLDDAPDRRLSAFRELENLNVYNGAVQIFSRFELTRNHPHAID